MAVEKTPEPRSPSHAKMLGSGLEGLSISGINAIPAAMSDAAPNAEKGWAFGIRRIRIADKANRSSAAKTLMIANRLAVPASASHFVGSVRTMSPSVPNTKPIVFRRVIFTPSINPDNARIASGIVPKMAPLRFVGRYA